MDQLYTLYFQGEKEKNKSDILVSSFDKSEAVNKILKPYVEGKNFSVDGKKYNKESFKDLTVFKTDIDYKKLYDKYYSVYKDIDFIDDYPVDFKEIQRSISNASRRKALSDRYERILKDIAPKTLDAYIQSVAPVTNTNKTTKTKKNTNKTLPVLYFPAESDGIKTFSEDKEAKDVTKPLLTKIDYLYNTVSSKGYEYKPKSKEAVIKPEAGKKSVFIVHGHNETRLNEVKDFVTKNGWTPIVIAELPNRGMTIIEKIEKYAEKVCFAIVLYTPCDTGYLNEEPIVKRYRARQNVVFEHGYLMSKLGREGVCALIDGEIEIPSDLGGVAYIKMDNEDKWKNQLLKEILEEIFIKDKE